MKLEDKVQDVTVTMNDRNVSLGCNYDGARYHVWLDTKNAMAPMPTLYKNPPAGTRPGSPHYYRTRHLSIDSKFGKLLVGVMVSRMKSGDLLLKAAEEESARNAAERAILEAARVKFRKEQATEQLYDALRTLLDASGGKGDAWEAINGAHAALDKADGK